MLVKVFLADGTSEIVGVFSFLDMYKLSEKYNRYEYMVDYRNLKYKK